MQTLARHLNRPPAQPLARLELDRVAAALKADLNGSPARRVEIHLQRARRAVDAGGGVASLGRDWDRPWDQRLDGLVTTLLARHHLRVGFDADNGWALYATDRPNPRQAATPVLGKSHQEALQALATGAVARRKHQRAWIGNAWRGDVWILTDLAIDGLARHEPISDTWTITAQGHALADRLNAN